MVSRCLGVASGEIAHHMGEVSVSHHTTSSGAFEQIPLPRQYLVPLAARMSVSRSSESPVNDGSFFPGVPPPPSLSTTYSSAYDVASNATRIALASNTNQISSTRLSRNTSRSCLWRRLAAA